MLGHVRKLDHVIRHALRICLFMADLCKNDLETCSVMILKKHETSIWMVMVAYHETVSHAVLTKGELSARQTTFFFFLPNCCLVNHILFKFNFSVGVKFIRLFGTDFIIIIFLLCIIFRQPKFVCLTFKGPILWWDRSWQSSPDLHCGVWHGLLQLVGAVCPLLPYWHCML